MRFPAFVLLIAVAALAHGAEMYRWTDEKGVVNYTPYPPPPNIRKVEPKKLGDTGKATASEAPYSEQLAAKNFPVTFYATPACGELCKTARAHLDKLANLYVTRAREVELVTTFKEATRLETDFWEMSWRAGLRIE